MTKPFSLTPDALYACLGLPSAPLILDVRSADDRTASPRILPGALLTNVDDVDKVARSLPRHRSLCVYCTHGGARSRTSAQKLRDQGFSAAVLDGGLEAWVASRYATTRLRDAKQSQGSRWITRERPKIDRLACPWLVRRFIDPAAQFFYTAPQRVRSDGESLNAEPYDIADVRFSHRGERCSFDAFLDEFDLHDPSIDAVADIVRAADTATLDRSPQAPGLLAISLGLSANQTDDIVLLEQAMPIYDALYAWCKTARSERHGWPQPTA